MREQEYVQTENYTCITLDAVVQVCSIDSSFLSRAELEIIIELAPPPFFSISVLQEAAACASTHTGSLVQPGCIASVTWLRHGHAQQFAFTPANT